MKTLYFVSLALLIMFSSYGQGYIPYPSTMIVCGYTLWQTHSNPSGTPNFYRTEIHGDTTIGGNTYYKCYIGINAPPVLESAIRNDSINKKVYKYNFSTGTEKLLYDFNMNVGDTVYRNDGYGFYDWKDAYTSIDTAWVSSIDSILMSHDGLYHKRFNFQAKVQDGNYLPRFLVSSTTNSCFNYNGSSGYFCIKIEPLVEGVGQINGPVSSRSGFEWAWSSTVKCASINGKTLYAYDPNWGYYMNPLLCNSLFTGLEELSPKMEYTISPNPSTGKFQINLSEANHSYTLKIYNSLGELILAKKITTNNEVDLSGQAKGIYFLKIYSDGKYAGVKKIAIQ